MISLRVPANGASRSILGVSLIALLTITACSTEGRKTPSATKDAGTAAATTGKSAPDSKVISLFDGKSLQGWAISDFAGRGEVKVEEGKIILGNGVMTGVTWTN